VPCSEAGCHPNSTNENEFCIPSSIDTLNGGCIGGAIKATPLAPFQIICGETWATQDGSGAHFDADWYMTQLETAQWVTWRIIAEFDFDYELRQSSVDCSFWWMELSGSGSACDTAYVTYPFDSPSIRRVFGIFPSASNPTLMPCNLGPWNYNISLTLDCDMTCPPGGADEGEGCSSDPSIDNFNGGCFSSPQVYSTITPGQPVCGQMSGVNYWRDIDWYRTSSPLAADEVLTWRVTANFPHVLYIIDQRYGCITRQIAGGASNACETTTLEWRVDSAGVYAFVIGASQSDNELLCADGPWEYTTTLEVCAFACSGGSTPEGEACGVGSEDNYNGGCHSPARVFQPITANDRICGNVWLTSDSSNPVSSTVRRDTDWYTYEAEAGEVLTFTVKAQFISLMGVVVLPNGCSDAYLDPVEVGWTRCDPVSVTYTVPVAGWVIFYVAPAVFDEENAQLLCDTGPWGYEAILESGVCGCNCHADPQCDGVTSIFDVTKAINVAFRGDPAIPDPSASCPYETTDVSCDGVTSIFDVTRMVNVAFRGSSATTEFCNPCP
jgi:hypothetical protein